MSSARVVQALKCTILLAPLALLPMTSCNNGGGGGGGSNAVTNALLACGLITQGKSNTETPTDAFSNCYINCVAQGTCAELESLVCGFGSEGEALFERCWMDCSVTHGHSCDGTSYPPEIVCDGFEQCGDGSDEVDCPPPFMCGDGPEIPPSWQCDGAADCEDGSDEQGCPPVPTFVCGDGEQIPAEWECDFYEDCSDGSDEANGCAMLQCANMPSETSGFTTATTLGTGGFDTGDTTGGTGP
jgi:hypothetical protein